MRTSMRLLAVVLSCIVTTAVAAAATSTTAADSPLTSQDLAKLRLVTSAVIAPDGSALAYTLAVPRDPLGGKDGPSFVELHVIRDGRSRPFVQGEVNVGEVQFSPDGKSLLFLAKRGGDKSKSLYEIPLDGGEARKLLEHETDLSAFAVHPVLRRVAFTATPHDKARKEAQEKGFSQEVFEEDWVRAQLFVADLDVEGAKPRGVIVDGHPTDLEWSSDGRHLLLALAPDPLVDSSYMRKRLHLIDAQSGQVVSRVDHTGKVGRSTVSPDGKLIALISALDEHDPAAGRLTVASSFGGITRELLPDFPGHFVTAAFADDDTIVYLADRGCETVLGEIGADGSGNRELLAQPGLIVTSLSLARGGKKAAFVAHTATHAPEVFAWDLGATATRLTDVNPWLAQRAFGTQEVFTYKARDELELQGILIHPLEGTSSRPHPLVVIVHGGPEAHFRNGWLTRYSEPGQVLAAKGYAVFFPNYRASTGRGVAFSQMDHKDPAGKEFDDLVDGVDALAATGLVDPKKVGVTGGSYGGYASAWCATKYSDRFAAAVMGFGVANLLSMVGTSDIPDEHFLVHHRLHPWEDWQLFLERSPIFHAPSSKTPILILAGKNDPRVPPSQSIEMYRYLKILDHPAVRLVLYPGEGHGNARAASRLDYHLRLLRWFDHYLLGPGGAPPPQELDHKTMLESQRKEPVATGS